MKYAISMLLMGGLSIISAAKLERAELELPRSISASRLSTATIIIDGIMEEAAWGAAAHMSNFVQRNPMLGEAPSEHTEFSVLYDDEYIYVGIVAHDSQPDSILSVLARRDERTPSDWVNISFDSYDDHRTAFEFWLNPQGVKRDIRRYDDDNMDVNWDAIWEGKAALTPEGWSAEFRIPLRELRFSSAARQDWGMQVYRHISRKNEDNYWTYWSKDEGGWVRHYGRLTDLTNIPRQRQIYISPYSTSQYAASDNYQTALHPNAYNLGQNLGVDLKIGVTNNLTLDVTINPDFGQVEADPAELNLSAFESFFSERRPFFVEGSNIYSFGLGVGDGDNSSTTLFYPRRIGRRPHFDGVEGVDGDAIDDASISYEIDRPNATTILGAAKLTGKTANGWSIGILEAVGHREQASIRYSDRETETYVIEPLTNYLVTRIQRDLNEGRTSLGAIITSVYRDLDGDRGNALFGEAQQDTDLMNAYLRRSALTGGIDFRHRFTDDTYELSTAVAGTRVSGTADVILLAQEHPNRYYQRPDAGHLTIDSSLTSLSGVYVKAVLSKIKGEHIIWAAGNLSYSPGFDANDIGFNRSVDNHTQFIWAQYRQNNKGEKILRWQLNFNGWTGYTFAGFEDLVSLGGNVNGNMTLTNYWSLGAGLNFNLPSKRTSVLWGGPAVKSDHRGNLWVYLESDSRKKFSMQANGWSGGEPESGSKWMGFFPGVTWRPTQNFTFRLSGGFKKFANSVGNWSGYGPTVDLQTGAEHYILSTRTQNTLSTTLRIDYTLTPTLSIQFYGAPFVTAGTYSNDKLLNLDQALSDSFDDRYTILTPMMIDGLEAPGIYDLDGDGVANVDMDNYWGSRNFNYKQFNSNLVIRWEYITGSSLYFVWSRNMSEFIEDGTFSGTQDLQNLFGLTGENIFLVKASYLLNI